MYKLFKLNIYINLKLDNKNYMYSLKFSKYYKKSKIIFKYWNFKLKKKNKSIKTN